MFTGIISAMTTIERIADKQGTRCLYLAKPHAWQLKAGDSVNVDGVCSTVAQAGKDYFKVVYMPETLRLTTIGQKKSGNYLNLEQSIKCGDKLSGHFVYGHVDTTGIIKKILPDKGAWLISVSYADKFAKYVALKGSITLDGISLTVMRLNKSCFMVSIVPYTWENTNLHFLKLGDAVNLEFDILAKYLEKIMLKPK